MGVGKNIKSYGTLYVQPWYKILLNSFLFEGAEGQTLKKMLKKLNRLQHRGIYYTFRSLNRIFDVKISYIRVLNSKISLIFELLNFADLLSYLTPAPFLCKGSSLNRLVGEGGKWCALF